MAALEPVDDMLAKDKPILSFICILKYSAYYYLFHLFVLFKLLNIHLIVRFYLLQFLFLTRLNKHTKYILIKLNYMHKYF